ncbi:MAG TPA: DUF3551 domain-containing protein, partial [Pseudolabrys sp.]|nr:DUF3551 domain-containing protein [Pseudolabrys sp.]
TLAAAMPTVSHADPYRWCAQYGRDSGRNCGFVTYRQCMATVSGIRGFCERNQFYTGRRYTSGEGDTATATVTVGAEPRRRSTTVSTGRQTVRRRLPVGRRQG